MRETNVFAPLLLRVIRPYFSVFIYSGLNDIQVEGAWIWYDGSPLSYSNWYVIQTDLVDL